jgi:hypothetical protein
LKLLSSLPVDVFILLPNLSINNVINDNVTAVNDSSSAVNDKSLLKIKYNNFISADTFPVSADEVQFVPNKNNSQHSFENTIYKDTNMHKNYQYINRKFRNVLLTILRVDAEEVYNLWNTKSELRPNFKSFGNGFGSFGDKIRIPIICAKFLGVPNGNVYLYWEKIKEFLSNNSIFLTDFPYIKSEYLSNDKNLLSSFIINGEIQKEKILNHSSYKYKHLREEMQEYMLKSLQKLLDSQTVKGTFENGTEYKIIDVALNLDAKFINLINGYDFTGKIPKLICIDTIEHLWSLEDSILIAYIRRLGVDIAFFSPTGYNNTEQYLKKEFFVEYIIGQDMDGLTAPNFEKSKFKK